MEFDNDIFDASKKSYATGEDTLFGLSGGSYLNKAGNIVNDRLLGDTGGGIDWLSSMLEDPSSDISKMVSNPANASKVSEMAQGLRADDLAIDKTSAMAGGLDNGVGATPQFLMAAAQTGLGFMNYNNAKEFNDVKMDAMKQNMALTQEQYDDYKEFKQKTENTYA